MWRTNRKLFAFFPLLPRGGGEERENGFSPLFTERRRRKVGSGLRGRKGEKCRPGKILFWKEKKRIVHRSRGEKDKTTYCHGGGCVGVSWKSEPPPWERGGGGKETKGNSTPRKYTLTHGKGGSEKKNSRTLMNNRKERMRTYLRGRKGGNESAQQIHRQKEKRKKERRGLAEEGKGGRSLLSGSRGKRDDFRTLRRGDFIAADERKKPRAHYGSVAGKGGEGDGNPQKKKTAKKTRQRPPGGEKKWSTIRCRSISARGGESSQVYP